MLPPGTLSTPGQQRIGGALLAVFTALLGIFLLFAFYAEASDGNASSIAPALPFGLALLCLSAGFARVSATAYGPPASGVGLKAVLPYMAALILVGVGMLFAAKGS